MSDQNVQVVKNAYAAFGRGDIQTILNNLTHDVEWVLPGEGEIPQAGVYDGKKGSAVSFSCWRRILNLPASNRAPSSRKAIM